MDDTSARLLLRLRTIHGEGAALAFLFDYDGTLVPLKEHPCLAVLDADARALLARLAEQPRVFVAVLSGRMLKEIKDLVGLANLYYAGTAGMEVDLRGRSVLHPREESCRRQMHELAAVLQPAIAAFPGAWLENKEYGLTVHYRRAVPAAHPLLQEQVRQAVQKISFPVRMVPGPMAVEFTSELGWTKGEALDRILEDIGPNAVPFYAGDEANDADAVETAARRGGFGIGVGPNAPVAALYRLENPAALFSLLSDFLRSMSTSG
ncbi:MAG: trehalose-phosphatase [Planctomycetes bacterium]|nr:trehalose-phosphatase [Planctomycetota bacterium]